MSQRIEVAVAHRATTSRLSFIALPLKQPSKDHVFAMGPKSSRRSLVVKHISAGRRVSKVKGSLGRKRTAPGKVINELGGGCTIRSASVRRNPRHSRGTGRYSSPA